MWRPTRLYSQNFEDLYLWRIFKEKEKGYYIDVGAWQAEKDSVTKIFYDQGWHGINVEPCINEYQELEKCRPRDLNLQVALSDHSRTGTLYTYGESGLHSLSQLAETSIQEEFRFQKKSQEVQITTLSELISKYCTEKIDFLKIDVEGEEANVIKGAQLNALPDSIKPKIILLEANRANSIISSSQRARYHEYLLSDGYVHLFDDGLNDYFCLKNEYSFLAPKMLPPNVFDGFPICYEVFSQHENLSLLLKQSTELLSVEQKQSTELLSVEQARLAEEKEAHQFKLNRLREKEKESDELRSLNDQIIEKNNILNLKVQSLEQSLQEIAKELESFQKKNQMERLERIQIERELTFYYHEISKLDDKVNWWRRINILQNEHIQASSKVARKLMALMSRVSS